MSDRGRPQAPRLAPLEVDDIDPEVRPLVEGAGGLHIFRTLARHPKLLKRWLVFGAHVLSKSTLPARERELVILRTGWLAGSDYEFGQHTAIGRAAGLSETEIRRVPDGPDAAGWSEEDRVLLRAVDELVSDQCLGDDVWSALADRWEEQQVMDLVFTVGQYLLVAMALNSFGVQREDGVAGFPV